MNIIKLENVAKFYKGRAAVQDISLSIEQGESIVILGPSGCGKTTILRMIAGFIAPDNGTVSIEGKVVALNRKIIKPPEERNIGFVFQDLAMASPYSQGKYRIRS